MEPLTDLLVALLVPSGLYSALALLCALIERLPARGGVRTARSRTAHTRRRTRSGRIRRRRESEDGPVPPVPAAYRKSGASTGGRSRTFATSRAPALDSP